MTLSAEKSGVPMGFAAKVGFDSSCGGRKVIKKWIWIPWDSSAFFYHHFGWNAWNILFHFFFQASFTTSKSKFLGSTLEKEARGSINLTYEFLWILGVFEDFILLPGRNKFPR